MKKRILNVGCGDDTYGTDFLDLYPKRKEVKKYNADVDKIPFRDNTFDEIVSNNMFEHLRNHKLFLEECYRVLKKGGKITLVTDNALFWGWAINRTHRGGYDGEHGEFDWHYALFTKQHLKNHLKMGGFKLKEIKYCEASEIAFYKKIAVFLVNLLTFYDCRYPRILIISEK